MLTRRFPILLALLLALSAPAEAARQVSTTFYIRTGRLPACGVHRPHFVQVAVSRDLRAAYPCGTRVGLTLGRPVAGRWVLTGIVSDTTGPRARNTIDILVPTRAQALAYGRVRATLRRLP